MTEKELTVIKSRTLILKEREKSSEVLLADPDGGDTYLTFELRYVSESGAGFTDWKVIDSQHASFVIDVRANAITRPNEPILIGTFGKKEYPLYLGFVVQPQIGQTSEHEVTITFYIRKEGANGKD